MAHIKRAMALLVFLLVSGLVVVGCSVHEGNNLQTSPAQLPTFLLTADPTPDPALTPVPDPTPVQVSVPVPVPDPTPSPKPVVSKAGLSAIGDILIHNTVYQDAAGPNGTYNFKPMFTKVKPIIQGADVAIANQETVIGGSKLGLSSYPLFNSPYEVGDALLDTGISMVTNANNHAMDMGEKGILSASEYWNQIGMLYTGSFVSQADRDRIRTITKNNITFSFLAYTYGTNGITVPTNKPYLVNVFEEEMMKKDIEKAKLIADVVVVSAHWGIENDTTPSDDQLDLAQKLADWGADIIIGTHPHVLQPMNWITRKDGKRTFVMYSLGNFLSAQDRIIQLIGGIGQITVVKTQWLNKTSIELIEPVFIPTYNKYESFRHFEVIPLSEVSEQERAQLESIWKPLKQTMKAEMPELTIRE